MAHTTLPPQRSHRIQTKTHAIPSLISSPSFSYWRPFIMSISAQSMYLG